MIPKVKDRVIEIQEKIAACLSIKTDQLVFTIMKCLIMLI